MREIISAIEELRRADPYLARQVKRRLRLYPDPVRKLWLLRKLLAWQRRCRR